MKKNILAGSLAGFFIGLLSIPVAYNFGMHSFLYLFIISLVLFVGSIFASIVGSLLGKWMEVLFQITKFIIVGVLNTFVDFGVLNLLMVVFSVVSGVWYTVFKSISFIVSVANSYIWNKYWTFESHKKSDISEATSFLAVSIIGFVINVMTASVVVNNIPVLFGVNDVAWANIGALCGTLLALSWNFIGYKFFVFKNKKV